MRWVTAARARLKLRTNNQINQIQIYSYTMEASVIFESVLNLIKSSNLNYHLEQSPFSANISLKKSVIKDRAGNPLKPLPPPDLDLAHKLEIENGSLIAKIKQAETQADDLRAELKQFEILRDASDRKRDELENNLKKSCDEVIKKCEEINIIKKSFKNLNDDQINLKIQLSSLNKTLKEKDRIIHKLETKVDNIEDNCRRAKENANSLKQERKKLEN